ncbi:granule-bound starch synthase [Tanacetum coccineum]
MGGGLSKLPLWLEVDADDDEDGTNHNLPSSIYKVLSSYDLLMEILLRLPIISLHLFKPVCKQWLSLITSPSFTLTRTRSSFWSLLDVGPRIPMNTITISCHLIPEFQGKGQHSLVYLTQRQIYIVQSCNGLILCYIYGVYSIYNPLMSMFKILPPIHDLYYERKSYEVINFAFDPTKSPFYKVVHVASIEDDDDDDDRIDYSIRIQTYSSESGVWSVSVRYCGPSGFNKDTNPLPLTVKGQVHRDHGLLLLCKDHDPSRYFNIYEMKNENSVRSVKYFVNLDHMMRPYPTWKMPANWTCRHHMLSVVLGERDEDSFMVIELSGKILKYKFMLEQIRV